jgi:type I restriction enzyme S subunit
MSLRRYPAYVESGIEWIGPVPKGWRIAPLKRLLHEMGSGGTPDTGKSEFWSEDDDGIPWVAIADMSSVDLVMTTSKMLTLLGIEERGLRVWPQGTLLFSMYASLGHVAELAVPAAINQALLALVPHEHCDQRFLRYWLESIRPHLRAEASSNTQDNLNAEKVGRLVCLVPPLPVQMEIADFLSQETIKIDALIAEQEKLLTLLAEKRQAVISQAITRGLDSHVPMKESGVSWLGEIPSHWQISPLKWLTQPDRPIMYGIVLPGPDVGEGVPILKGGNVKPSRMCLGEMAWTTPEIEAPYARARLRVGDLVYSIRGTIGDCEVVPAELNGANITQDVARVAVDGAHCASWVRWALLASAIREELACGSLGAAVRGVNIFDLKRVRLPLPPKEEQLEIAAHIDRESARIDSLMAECDKAIALMREHRSALISAAITGKIDVRGLVDSKEDA